MIYVFYDHEVDWEWNRDNIGKALLLSENCGVGCLYGGEDKSVVENSVSKLGVEKLIYSKISRNETYLAYAQFVCEICKIEYPELIIFPGSKLGKAVAATCSISLEAGLVADCIDITKDCNGSYIFSRTALNASVIAQIKGINHRMMMCTTKQNAFPFQLEYTVRTDRPLHITKINADSFAKSNNIGYEIIESIECEQSFQSNLLSSPIVFSVGRGISQQSIDKLQQLTQRSNLALGCTRAVVEAGSLPKSMQIGQSGKVIAPELLILLGVSGASQHMAGIMNSKKIISINIDKNAPVREICDISIIADANEVITFLFDYMRRSSI